MYRRVYLQFLKQTNEVKPPGMGNGVVYCSSLCKIPFITKIDQLKV